jgi:hypothetical protein
MIDSHFIRLIADPGHSSVDKTVSSLARVKDSGRKELETNNGLEGFWDDLWYPLLSRVGRQNTACRHHDGSPDALLGVIFGHLIHQWVPPNILKKGAATVFIVIGVIMFFGKF